MKYIEAEWSIGTYSGGKDSLCVNLDFGGQIFHRHDFGGLLPRAVRIGRFIEQLEDESGCRNHQQEFMSAFESAQMLVRDGETIGAAMVRLSGPARNLRRVK